jgi:anti-sigma factor RsiW
MDHRDYIELYLSADADSELSADERQAARAHLQGCAGCRARLAEERATKALLQKNFPMVEAPAALRARISAALDAADHEASRQTARVIQLRRPSRGLRTPLAWAAAATAVAALLALTLVSRQRQEEATSPAFDAAIASFQKSEAGFEPTVGANSTDQLALALIDQFGVAPIWDFSSIGLRSAGGRIERASDGSAAAYTLYKGANGSLLCKIVRDRAFRYPPGGVTVKGIHIYRYKGFSVAATNRYSVFCVMVTRLPPEQLAHAFDQLPA